jgi:hypothetical protein
MIYKTVSLCSHLHTHVICAYMFVSEILMLCNSSLFLSQQALSYRRLSFILYVCSTRFIFLSGANDVSISSRQLYSLLNEKKMNILILDSRSATCYANSHMTVGNCINVPEEIVKPG